MLMVVNISGDTSLEKTAFSLVSGFQLKIDSWLGMRQVCSVLESYLTKIWPSFVRSARLCMS